MDDGEDGEEEERRGGISAGSRNLLKPEKGDVRLYPAESRAVCSEGGGDLHTAV